MITFDTEQGEGRAYVAVPESGSGPGVLVLHAWWGLTPMFTGVCDRLAQAGFVALAPDLHHGQTAATVAEAEALVQQSEGPGIARTQAVAAGGLAQLRAHPAVQGDTVGALGFSMGAAWAIGLATHFPADIAAVVLFYGAYSPDFTQTRAAFLGHFAETDAWEPPENAREMEAALRAAGREVTIHHYPNTGHWFFESDRPEAYQPEAAQLAWQRSLEFLRRYL